jgi:hypothetical protein
LVRWTETGKGTKGSIFVSSTGESCRAKKIGSTVGGLQKWKLSYAHNPKRKHKQKTVYLKNRRELKDVVRGAK